jgi:pyrroloquinoline quinone biosynthesis protein D
MAKRADVVSAKIIASSLTPDCRPRLREGVRLHRDRLSGREVLLFPEGILQLNSTAVSILKSCDGDRNVKGIVADLSANFETSYENLCADVAEFLLRLCDRQLLYLLFEETS